MRISEILTEKWSAKYKNSINCSHPKGFSQRAHCAGKRKHNESHEVMEMTCPDCGRCQTHGNINEIKKGQKDANGFTRCWPNKHAEGTKKGKNGGQVRKCVPNESVAEGGSARQAAIAIAKQESGKYRKDGKRLKEESDKKCPPATQDITLNLKNRQKAINEYGYGPLNPDLPNSKFWMKKVDEWNLDSADEAKSSLCGNCAAFDQREDTLACIAQGIGSDAGETDPTIKAGDLGYCRFLKFKCAARRTCDAWVTGGPLTDNMKKAGKRPKTVDEDSDNQVGFSLETEKAYQAVIDAYGDYINHDEDSGIMYVPRNLWGRVEQTAFDADGIGAEETDGFEHFDHYDVEEELSEEFDLVETIIDQIAAQNGVDSEVVWGDLESLTEDELYAFAVTSQLNEDWQKANKKDKTDGMSKKAVSAYRREHPGSKLKTAVTTKPSKLKRGSKASKRRKSYCSRSRGQMKMHNISCAKTPDKAICKARRRWNC